MSARRPRTGRNIRFVIYHSAYRWTGGAGALAKDGYAQFEQTGRVEWTSDLADIPGKYGVSNVYADLGQIFAQTTVVEPRLCAALMGMLIKGMGADHVVWGTDALWTGAPQWQIEGLRRLEIPEEMRRKYGFAELGPADGPVKQAIFGGNSAKMYRYDDQEGRVARRPLRRDQVGLRAQRPRSLQPALRVTSFLRDSIRHRRVWPDRAETRGAPAGRRRCAGAIVGRDRR